MQIPQQKIIDLTNHFYLEMSKNILTEKEYDIMQKILIKHDLFQSISVEYGVSKEAIRHIYKKVFFKIKTVSGLVNEINVLKEKKELLRKEYISEYIDLTKRNEEKNNLIISKKIHDSHFPFSKRLWNMLNRLEIYTFKDLFEIPLNMYPDFRGFTGRCLKEFILFIEFENIEDCFDSDFYEFKRKYDIS